uniref:Cas scaffold protein family member 4 n=1 Tax=Dicentrarchus labrax TaxID=13489 RepID=A0A8C4IV38_DICLA
MAFRKGDIVTVMDQNVAGTSGWWMCSLYGRHGLAPANRLQLLPQTRTISHVTEKPKLIDATTGDSVQNIYQIPSVYDVPSQGRRASLFNVTVILTTCSCAQVYAVPPPLPQDPNYDIPVPSTTDAQQKMIAGYSTLPNPRKPEWIYDVPVGPEKQSPPQGSYDILPSKTVCRDLYDTLPVHARTIQRGSPAPLLYDIPKPSSPPKVLPRAPIYDKPPTQRHTEESVYVVPPQEDPLTRVLSDSTSDHIPLECRRDSNNAHELKRVRLQRMRNFLACTSFRDLPGSGDTASSSSTSSCDSLALSSSSPEPLREVTVSQDEACRRLLDLQESVCKAVPRLMDFVSSHWRSKGHLEKHLKEIKEAADGIACSLTSFLNFALDVKGNAHRLTDANLQTRLCKQLSIVEDSGVILQQTVSALNIAGWPLNTLCQDLGQVQTPDQLERFVMVARTVPEDVKRLVSIINANGKLLFRAPQKDPEPLVTTGQPDTKKSPDGGEEGGDIVEDDNDYVELQTKTDFEKQKKVQNEPKENVTPVSNKVQAFLVVRKRQETLLSRRHDMWPSSPFLFHVSTAQADNKCHSSESSTGTEEHPPSSLSEHCRLYFGALQKAIGGFVDSLRDGQPPENFIRQSKLVIMVGQRLVDTLCREAQHGESSRSLLCKSNHLCALLKQLAVATKKAALHFPDTQALHEAQEFAKELAQRAQHFRKSLDSGLPK